MLLQGSEGLGLVKPSEKISGRTTHGLFNSIGTFHFVGPDFLPVRENSFIFTLSVKKLINSYREVDKPVLQMIAAEFWLQLINAAFFLILNIYLAKKGYSDAEIGKFVKYRFLAVMLLSLPLGIALKGKRMRPLFYISAIGVPLLSLLTIFAAERRMTELLNLSYLCWGFCFAFLQVGSLPYILRNCSREHQSKAIVLNFTVQSANAVIAGFIIFFLHRFHVSWLSDAHILAGFALLGFVSIYHLLRIRVPEVVDRSEKPSGNRHALAAEAVKPKSRK